MGKPTFPDQQQDLQNAADSRIASECDGSVKFAGLAVGTDSTAIRLMEDLSLICVFQPLFSGFVTSKACGSGSAPVPANTREIAIAMPEASLVANERRNC
jgi:hypothetical protein